MGDIVGQREKRAASSSPALATRVARGTEGATAGWTMFASGFTNARRG
jgi:hypothetical protein